jgi:hypothetical protein
MYVKYYIYIYIYIIYNRVCSAHLLMSRVRININWVDFRKSTIIQFLCSLRIATVLNYLRHSWLVIRLVVSI